MKNSYLRLAFFGYIFIFFFFKINGVELLPDFIGYLLVAIALVSSAKENKFAQAALVIAVILFIFSMYPLEFDKSNSIYRDGNLVILIIFVLIILMNSLCRWFFYKTCSKNNESISFWFVILRPIIQFFVLWILTYGSSYNEFLLNLPILTISVLEILYLFRLTFVEH